MSMAYVAVAISVISAGMGAYASYEQGQAQKEQADYQAKVNEQNAQIAYDQQMDALNRGANEAADKRQETQRLAARQRAMAQGIDPDSGTMGLLQDETQTLGNLDALRIFNNSQRQAYGYKVDETNSLAQAAGNRFAGENASAAGKMGAVSSLLSGAASTAGMAYNFNKAGAFNTYRTQRN